MAKTKKEQPETISIKTLNGTAEVVRTKHKAVITSERNCYGFNEKSVTEVIKIDDDCMHYAFGTTQSVIDCLKNN